MKRFLISIALLLGMSALFVSCNKDNGGSTDWSKIERMVVGSKWTILGEKVYGYYEFTDKNSYRYYGNLSQNKITVVNGIIQASEEDFTYIGTVNLSVKAFFTGELVQIEGIQVKIIDNDTIRVYSPIQDVTVDLVRIKGFLK